MYYEEFCRILNSQLRAVGRNEVEWFSIVQRAEEVFSEAAKELGDKPFEEVFGLLQGKLLPPRATEMARELANSPLAQNYVQ